MSKIKHFLKFSIRKVDTFADEIKYFILLSATVSHGQNTKSLKRHSSLFTVPHPVMLSLCPASVSHKTNTLVCNPPSYTK